MGECKIQDLCPPNAFCHYINIQWVTLTIPWGTQTFIWQPVVREDSSCIKKKSWWSWRQRSWGHRSRTCKVEPPPPPQHTLLQKGEKRQNRTYRLQHIQQGVWSMKDKPELVKSPSNILMLETSRTINHMTCISYMCQQTYQICMSPFNQWMCLRISLVMLNKSHLDSSSFGRVTEAWQTVCPFTVGSPSTLWVSIQPQWYQTWQLHCNHKTPSSCTVTARPFSRKLP